MKKVLTLIVACGVGLLAYGQAKKPIIMVIPSDVYCVKNGYVTSFDVNGSKQDYPDYKKLLQNDREIRLAITKIGTMMADRGFPLKDMEQTLKSIEQSDAESAALTGSSGAEVFESPTDRLKRVAKADIIMDLDFSVERKGPRNVLTFNLRGLDAYTSKQVAGAAGVGAPSSFATVDLLIEEAVLNYMDEFNGRLQAHFDDMFANGREIKLQVKRFNTAPFNFEDEFEYEGQDMEVIDIVDEWLSKNTVKGRFSRVDATENFITYEQVRIPLFETRGSREVPVDARAFATNLRNQLLRKAPISTDAKIYQRGLGEVWLIVGEK